MSADIKKISFPTIIQSAAALLIAITTTDALRDTINSYKLEPEKSAMARLAMVCAIIVILYLMITWDAGDSRQPDLPPKTVLVSATDNSLNSAR